MERGDFSFVEAVVTPSDTQPAGAHVIDYEVQKLLSRGWHAYVSIIGERAGPNLHPAAVREITTSFEGECHGGDELMLGVRAVARSRRSYTLEEQLWNPATDRDVARSRVVMTAIDRSTGRAAEVHTDFWTAVEAFEGRQITFASPP